MQRPILLFILTPALLNVSAQCELTIPPDATTINMVADTTVAMAEGYFWVCDGVTAHFTGNNSFILGEEGSFLHIFGDNNTVVSKAGVMIHGMNTNTYVADAALVDDMGSNTNLIVCSEIIFHLDTAPPNGCMILGIGEFSGSHIGVHPNPVMHELEITFDQERLPNVWVTITDLHGRSWISEPLPGNRRIDVSALASGLYNVSISTSSGRVVRMIRKE